MGKGNKAHTWIIHLNRPPWSLGRTSPQPVETFSGEEIADREALHVVLLFHSLLLLLDDSKPFLFPIPKLRRSKFPKIFYWLNVPFRPAPLGGLL